MHTELTSLFLSAAAFCVSLSALIVAIFDWNQVGREEPWKLTKVDTDIWLLERVHRSPVMVLSLLNFHGSEVGLTNDADLIDGPFRRGRREVLHIKGSELGTSLDVSYRRAHGRLFRKLLGEEKFQWMGAGDFPTGKGIKHWSTPLY